MSTSLQIILRTLAILALVGLALAGQTTSGLAQANSKSWYAGTNLREFGIPNFEDRKAYRTKWLDRDLDGKKETRLDFYVVDNKLIATYSYDNRIYSLSMDTNFASPVELSLIDKKGQGKFEPLTGVPTSAVPSWLY
ncbi:MAG: hypothetical protein ACR2OW_09715 [Methyloligellaceae bacterium]